MSLRALKWQALAIALTAGAAQPVFAQAFSEDFDTAPAPSEWNITVAAPIAVNPDYASVELFYNYSALGIPSAPNSTGGSTRGMRLRANIGSTDSLGAVNVTPAGKSFTGDYSVKFDLWSNFLGDGAHPDPLRYGGTGSTNFSMYGIMSNGGANYINATNGIGVADALYFANSGDGQQTFDYRVHGPGKLRGYFSTTETGSATATNNYDPVLDAGVTFGDVYPAVYPSYAGPTYAGQPHPDVGETNRGVDDDELASFALGPDPRPDGFTYIDAFPAVAAPDQAAISPYSFTQGGSTMPGAMGMAWREVEIKKVGNIVTWNVLDTAIGNVTLATVDLSIIGGGAPTGNNIMFGHSDLFNGQGGGDTNYAQTMFTLIDNIRVEALTVEPTEDADFDNDSDVDGNDFLIWQRGLGVGTTNGAGDADGNNVVNALDLAIWKAKFGLPGAAAVASAVPEPGALGLAMFAMAALAVRRTSFA